MKNCKHTNCLHYRGTRIEYAPGVESPSIDRNATTGEPIRSVLVDARICECGAWLPLGPARDTAETAIEVRAAELARRHVLGLPLGTRNLDEDHGWHDYIGRGGDCGCSTSEAYSLDANWHSGYLAAAMLDEVSKPGEGRPCPGCHRTAPGWAHGEGEK